MGQTDGETQRIQIKDLQEGSEYMIRVMARNEVGISDPLEPEEPVRVIRPAGKHHTRNFKRHSGIGKDFFLLH